jgi:serine/threonine protein kinase
MWFPTPEGLFKLLQMPQVIRNNKGYSLEVDIWSLGCTIIEMGTGRHPWHQYADVCVFTLCYIY